LDESRARAQAESGGTFNSDFGDASNRSFVFWNDRGATEIEYNELRKKKENREKIGSMLTPLEQIRFAELEEAINKFNYMDNQATGTGGTPNPAP
jgi:hypothetical protein